VAPLAVSIGVLLCAPDIEHYRGLSGIDSALFALLATLVWRRRSQHSRRALLLALVPAALFLGKIAYEVIQGGALFLPGEGVPSPVPVAHLTGALCGLCIGLAPTHQHGTTQTSQRDARQLTPGAASYSRRVASSTPGGSSAPSTRPSPFVSQRDTKSSAVTSTPRRPTRSR